MTKFSRYWNFLSSFSPSTSKYFSSIYRSHSFSETVFVSSLSFWWLKRSFWHCLIFLKSSISLLKLVLIRFSKLRANIQRVFTLANLKLIFFWIVFTTFAISKINLNNLQQKYKIIYCRFNNWICGLSICWRFYW